MQNRISIYHINVSADTMTGLCARISIHSAVVASESKEYGRRHREYRNIETDAGAAAMRTELISYSAHVCVFAFPFMCVCVHSCVCDNAAQWTAERIWSDVRGGFD